MLTCRPGRVLVLQISKRASLRPKGNPLRALFVLGTKMLSAREEELLDLRDEVHQLRERNKVLTDALMSNSSGYPQVVCIGCDLRPAWPDSFSAPDQHLFCSLQSFTPYEVVHIEGESNVEGPA